MSSRNYQELHRYKGSLYGRPEYNGIEYDFEVPDNLVTASPKCNNRDGGISLSTRSNVYTEPKHTSYR
jgi:hypothetical protein